jgi:hypothetical protein
MAAVAFTGLSVLLVIGSLIAVRSDWFRDQVRERIIREVERATGGRTEIGDFSFDWSQLRAVVRNFVLRYGRRRRIPFVQRELGRVRLRIISLYGAMSCP